MGHGVAFEAPFGAQIEPRRDLLGSDAYPFSSSLVAAKRECTGAHGVASAEALERDRKIEPPTDCEGKAMSEQDVIPGYIDAD